MAKYYNFGIWYELIIKNSSLLQQIKYQFSRLCKKLGHYMIQLLDTVEEVKTSELGQNHHFNGVTDISCLSLFRL